MEAVREYRWRKTGIFGRAYELSRDLEIVGLLRVSGFAGRRAEYESSRERYLFTRRGRRFQVADESGTTLGELRLNWFGGAGQLYLSGMTVGWRRIGWMGRVHVFEDGSGGEPLRFRSSSGWRGAGATVEVPPKWAESPNLGLLLGLGFFQLVQAYADASAAGAGAAASA